MNSVERGGVGVRHQVVSSIYAGGTGECGIMRGRGQRDRGAGGGVVDLATRNDPFEGLVRGGKGSKRWALTHWR